MSDHLATNTMPAETRVASDAAVKTAMAEGVNVLKPRRKYIEVGKAKKTRTKGNGNGGKVGRRFRAEQRGHTGGKETSEQKARSEAQSAAFSAWRGRWMTGDAGPQPG